MLYQRVIDTSIEAFVLLAKSRSSKTVASLSSRIGGPPSALSSAAILRPLTMFHLQDAGKRQVFGGFIQ